MQYLVSNFPTQHLSYSRRIKSHKPTYAGDDSLGRISIKFIPSKFFLSWFVRTNGYEHVHLRCHHVHTLLLLSEMVLKYNLTATNTRFPVICTFTNGSLSLASVIFHSNPVDFMRTDAVISAGATPDLFCRLCFSRLITHATFFFWVDN